MNKTKIPWADYTINPVKGLCPMACPYCYARRMYKRFKWDETIRYDETLLCYEHHPQFPDGSKVFIGSTMELFGEWVDPKWLSEIFHDCWSRYPKVTFIFLTKQPQNLIRWSPFPDNCWVGVSAISNFYLIKAMHYLNDVQASVKFISVEPFLRWHPTESMGTYAKWLKETGINWLIIGSRTQPVRHPEKAWVDEIIDAADKASIPVFVKEPMASHFNIHRQEYPLER